MALATTAASPVGASPCPVPKLSAAAVSTPSGVIEDGGGVIVAVINNFGEATNGEEVTPTGGAHDGDLVVRSAWRFRGAGKLIAPTIDKIAPGLAVYRPPAMTMPEYVLETSAHKTVASARRSADRDASVLGAPVVVGGGETTFTGRRGGGALVTVHLVSTPPKGARIMVAYGPDKVARSFGYVDATSKNVLVWRTRSGCELGIPGEIPTAVGDKITVAWLDESGRLSARSAPIEIKQEKTK